MIWLPHPGLGPAPALRSGRVHEVTGAAARAFAAAQAGLRAGPIVWITGPTRKGAARLDPYGAAAFFDPARLLLVEAKAPDDVFWAMEEALRSGAAPFVVAEPFQGADLTRSRRLQLAAEAGGSTGLSTPPDDTLVANATETRWRAEPASDFDDVEILAGGERPVWRWELLKNKRGPLGDWRVGWDARARPPRQAVIGQAAFGRHRQTIGGNGHATAGGGALVPEAGRRSRPAA